MESTSLLGIGGHPGGPASTLRNDRWWIEPAITVAVLLGFVIYATWAALPGEPLLRAALPQPLLLAGHLDGPDRPGRRAAWHAAFGVVPDWWPAAIPFSPAFLILAFPGAFRFTCYYYRKAYYRAFFGVAARAARSHRSPRTASATAVRPPGCSGPEPAPLRALLRPGSSCPSS